MKTLLLILIILLLAGVYVYWRLRPYIKMARQIFGGARDLHRVRFGGEPADLPRVEKAQAAEPLVRCASCETWLPTSRAVRLGRSSTAYCSHECLERAAQTHPRTRKSAP